MTERAGAVGYVPMQVAAGATGNGTAVTCTDAVNGAWRYLTMQVVISNTATVTFEATIDGTNWVTLSVVKLADASAATTAAASGLYRADVTGLTQVRARISAWTSGTVTVSGVLTAT